MVERRDNQLPSGRRSAEEYVSMESAEAETARIALDNMDDILDSMDRLVEKLRQLKEKK